MINFVKYRFLYLAISLCVIVPGVTSLLRFGLRPSIDFTGGTEVEYRFDPAIDKAAITSALAPDFKPLSIEKTQLNTYVIKLSPVDENQVSNFNSRLKRLSPNPIELRYETLGPSLGKELLEKTIIGLILATALILCYIAYAFKNLKFGVCATLATIHDSLVILGIFSILGATRGVEVDSLFVTALLTVLSFSVHDTVVVFDRIRESQKTQKHIPLPDLINKALNETMVRSLNNSLTIIFMLSALLLLGGTTTKWFVLALLVGTISGTYSSPFVATPLLLLWDKLFPQRRDNLRS